MVKLASIDLGSNSTRLLIAEVNDQGFNVLIRKACCSKNVRKHRADGSNLNGRLFKRVKFYFKKFLKN